MKKWIFLSLAVIILAALTYTAFNWKPILLSLSGFTPPRIENGQTIASWPGLKQTQYDLLMSAASKESYYTLQKDLGVPGIIVFNMHGLPVVSSRGEGCQVVARNKLKTLRASDSVPVQIAGISISNLEALKKHLNVADGDMETLNSKDHDFIAVYTWAKYFPKRSEGMIEAVAEGLKETTADILVVSVNLDFMDDWTEGDVGEKIEYDL